MTFSRCAFSLGLALVWACGSVPASGADFSSPLPNVTVSLAGSTVNYQVTDPVRGTTPSGSANAPGVVSAPVPSGGVLAWWADKVVRYRIYDIVRGAWMGGNVNRQDAVNVTDPQNRHGVVAFGADASAYSVVYDSARGSWMVNGFLTAANIVEVQTAGGVAAWVSGTTVYYGAYEPAAGEWRNGGIANPGVSVISDLTVADGIVAWSAGTTVFCRIYDHSAAAWRGADVVGPGYITDLIIANATVSWTSGTQNYTAGYNPNTGAWQNGSSLPRSKFTPYPASGNAPMVVWFTDLSIGATSRSWAFGDGDTSTSRTPYHQYAGFDRYTVTLAVTGSAGTHSTNTVLLTDTNAPTGSISINDGAQYTPFTNVTMALSAADNSSAAVKMRFSNQDTTSWTAWEPYAPTKAWTVTSGEGQKTVYASFKDQAGNISTTVSDSISLYTRKPTVAFATNNFVGTESNRSATITVVLSASTVFTSAVSYATVDGQATAPADYTSTSGRLTFRPGELSKSFNVSLVNDDLPEINETFQIILSDATNIVVGAVGTATIMDNDPPFVSFASAAYSIGEDLGQAVVNAVLSTASGRTVTVQYATQNGTALAGADYVGVTNRLTFVPGQTNSSFVVPILNDSLDEPEKVILLSLSLPTNGVLGTLTNAVLNLSDDDPPTAYFGTSTFFVAEPEGSIDIPVLLSSTYTQVVSVGYRTFNGSASVGSDYIAASGTLIYFPGQTNLSFPITLLPDSVVESMESVILVLTNFVVATPGVPSQATLNILDNASTPVLWAPVRPQSNLFQFNVIAAIGNQYAVEASTNLTNWAELSRFMQTNQMTGFQDTNVANYLKRFYRARKVN